MGCSRTLNELIKTIAKRFERILSDNLIWLESLLFLTFLAQSRFVHLIYQNIKPCFMVTKLCYSLDGTVVLSVNTLVRWVEQIGRWLLLFRRRFNALSLVLWQIELDSSQYNWHCLKKLSGLVVSIRIQFESDLITDFFSVLSLPFFAVTMFDLISRMIFSPCHRPPPFPKPEKQPFLILHYVFFTLFYNKLNFKIISHYVI